MTRKEAFLIELEKAKVGPVQDWFTAARKASAVKYVSEHLQTAFLVGAIPEVYSQRGFDLNEARSKNVYEQRFAGSQWRMKNPPDIVGCWFRTFRFEKEDGSYTTFRLPLDPVIIERTIRSVAKSKSFQ